MMIIRLPPAPIFKLSGRGTTVIVVEVALTHGAT